MSIEKKKKKEKRNQLTYNYIIRKIRLYTGLNKFLLNFIGLFFLVLFIEIFSEKYHFKDTNLSKYYLLATDLKKYY